MPKIIQNKLVKDWQKLWKSYSILTLLLNLVIAISMVGLGAVPLISDYLSQSEMFYVVGLLSLLGIVGRTIKQQGVDDV